MFTGQRRTAAIVIAITVTMATLFATSYTLALGRPTPHNIPAAVVGHTAEGRGLIAALERATQGGIALRPFPTEKSAQQAMDRQAIYATLALAPRPHLLLASAAGVSVARALEKAAGAVGQTPSGPLATRDVHPLPPEDPQGLVSFYAVLAATVLGFITVFQLRANASGLSRRGWWIGILSLAAGGGLLLAVALNLLIGALHAPFVELWAALSTEVAVAALFNAAMVTLIGRWAIVPTWAFFVILGNASSGGAVAPPLLPAVYGFLSRFLPAGATVEIVRNATYFRHHQQIGAPIVMGVWLLFTALALVVVGRLSGRTPGG